MLAVAGKVTRFAPVVLQVEQFGRVTHVVDVFPSALAHHIHRGDRAGRMVLAKGHAFGIIVPSQIDQGLSRQSLLGGVEAQPHALHNGWVNIDQGHRCLANLAHRDARSGDDHGHGGGFFVVHRLTPQLAVAQVVTMVGAVDDAGVLAHPAVLQRVEHLTDVVVQKTHHPVIGRQSMLDLFRRETVVVIHAALERRDHRVCRRMLRPIQPWHGNRVKRIQVVERLGRYEREMRLHEGHEQAPGLVELAGQVGEPLHCSVTDVAVVQRVGGLPRTGRSGQIGRAAARGRLWRAH